MINIGAMIASRQISQFVAIVADATRTLKLATRTIPPYVKIVPKQPPKPKP
jgi:hypothetical protein